MKKKKFSLFIFIDALGWEVLQTHYPRFLQKQAPYSRPLETIFGYSSACDPSIISGLLPQEHGHWSCFYYAPGRSPFKGLAPLSWLPAWIADNHRTRHYLSRLLAKWHGYTGYFQIYNVPFRFLHYFDYTEKKWIYGPQGLIKGRTLFDEALQTGVPHFVSPLGLQDDRQLSLVREAIQKGEVRFAYVTLGKLDALMHHEGTQSEKIVQLLQEYEREIQELLQEASQHYEETTLFVFSDHGMHDTEGEVDLQSMVNALGLSYGKDYIALYDSTMARFWYLNEEARCSITSRLKNLSKGHFLSVEEKKAWGIFFPDHKFGEDIFLMNPGQLIVPSFMGRKGVPGMHGYHPAEAKSKAVILSSQPIPEEVISIADLYGLMKRDLALASLPSNGQKVAVIMRSRNAADVIGGTLKALFSQTFSAFSLHLVDSSSTDETLEIARRFPVAITVLPAEDYFPGKVLNGVIEGISADLIVFLNSDAELLHPDSLTLLLAAFHDPAVQAAFGRQIPREGAATWVRRDYEVAFPPQAPAPSWMPLSLCFSAMRRSAWEKHPFYTAAWGSEDVEWGVWARLNGGEIRYVPGAVCLHSHNYTLRQLYGRKFIEGEADAFIYQTPYSFARMMKESIKAILRDIPFHLRLGDFKGAFLSLLRRPVSYWGYYSGHRWGSARFKAGNPDASTGQRTVLKHYD